MFKDKNPKTNIEYYCIKKDNDNSKDNLYSLEMNIRFIILRIVSLTQVINSCEKVKFLGNKFMYKFFKICCKLFDCIKEKHCK